MKVTLTNINQQNQDALIKMMSENVQNYGLTTDIVKVGVQDIGPNEYGPGKSIIIDEFLTQDEEKLKAATLFAANVIEYANEIDADANVAGAVDMNFNYSQLNTGVAKALLTGSFKVDQFWNQPLMEEAPEAEESAPQVRYQTLKMAGK